MQLVPMASSPDGLISARCGGGGGGHHLCQDKHQEQASVGSQGVCLNAGRCLASLCGPTPPGRPTARCSPNLAWPVQQHTNVRVSLAVVPGCCC